LPLAHLEKGGVNTGEGGGEHGSGRNGILGLKNLFTKKEKSPSSDAGGGYRARGCFNPKGKNVNRKREVKDTLADTTG